MSFKEVNSLRKSGELEEATLMAREDLATNRDKWSCIALFWCLYEATKNASMESLVSLVDEMRNLLEDMGDDSMAAECIQRIEKRLIPHAETIRSASEDAKNPATADSAYRTVFEIHNSGELHNSYHTDFAWIIWRTLHSDTSENAEYRKGLIDVYRQLDIERPSRLHSLILNEAVRLEKACPQMFMFTEFIDWWGLRNLSAEDWEQFVPEDGNKQMSRVEKMIYLYTKEVLSMPDLMPSEEFLSVLDTAVGKWSNDDNLLRCKAMLVAKQGDVSTAIDLYKHAIEITSGRKFYLWGDLAAYVDDDNLKIGLLSKALMLGTQEEFVGKLRATLAQLLCTKEQYHNALYEIQKVQTTYEANGWNLPAQIRNVQRMIPIGVEPCDNTPLYSDWAKCVDAYLYEDIPAEYMVKVAHREDVDTKDGRQRRIVKWTLIDNKGDVVNIKPRHYNLRKANIGECFEVRRRDNRIVVISPTDAENVEWIKSIRGEISVRVNRDGNNFGFVENCYVPTKLVRQIANGANVEGIAVCQDGKWRCISIKTVQ